jgi:hypothetical protein
MKEYQIEIKQRFAGFDNLSDDKDINMAWLNVKLYIKYSPKRVQVNTT